MPDPTQDGVKYHGETAAIVKAKLHLDEAVKGVTTAIEHLRKTPVTYSHTPLISELQESGKRVQELARSVTREYEEMGL